MRLSVWLDQSRLEVLERAFLQVIDQRHGNDGSRALDQHRRIILHREIQSDVTT